VRSIHLFIFISCVAITACVPSYVFTEESPDGSSPDAAADGSVDAASDAGPGRDATGLDSGADTSGMDASSADASSSVAVIAIDTGFPKTSQINNAEGTSLSVTFDVPGGGRALVAVVVWGQHGGSGVWPVTFDSPNSQWTLVASSVSMPSYVDAVGVGVWTTWVSVPLTAEVGTATSSSNVQADALLAIYSLSGASQAVVGSAFGTSSGFDGSDAPLSFTVDAHAAGSFVVGGLLDGNADPNLRGNTLPNTVYDLTLASSSQDALAVGRLSGLTTGPGNVTVGQDESVSNDVAAGVEILPASQ
jgi:hypothetical protein